MATRTAFVWLLEEGEYDREQHPQLFLMPSDGRGLQQITYVPLQTAALYRDKAHT